MTSEDFEDIIKKNEKIVKKSTFNGLIITVIIVIGIASFLGGSQISNLDSNQISQEELNDAIPMTMMIVMINPLNIDFLTIFSFFLIIFSELKYSILKISVLIHIVSFLKITSFFKN